MAGGDLMYTTRIHPYPSILEATKLTRLNPDLKSDWHCCIKLEAELAGVDYLSGERLSDKHLERASYHWLASIKYHQLKTID